MSRIGGGRRGEDGAVVVEFAIVFVLFVTLVSGIISFGAAFAAQQTLTHAASEGARALVGFGGEHEQAKQEIEEIVMGEIAWLDPPAEKESLKVDPKPCGDATCYTVTVAGSSPIPEILPVFSGENLSSSATVQVD